MAKIHRFPLNAPFWGLNLLEVAGIEEQGGRNLRVKHLYMLDPSEPSGMILLKTMPMVSLMEQIKNTADTDEVLE